MLAGPEVAAGVEAAVERAADRALELQRPDGSWVDELPSAAVATGAAALALHACDGDAASRYVDEACAWLRGAQSADGSWGDATGAEGTLNATAVAVAALAALGGSRSRAAVEAGRAWLEGSGGEPALEDRTRCTMSAVCLGFLAAAGLYPAERCRRIPVELVLLPPRLRRRLSFTLPGVLAWGVLHARTRPVGPWRRGLASLAEPRALAWLERLQAFDGFAGGFEESPLMAAIVCYGLARAGAAPAIVGRCRSFLLATRRDDGSWAVNRDLELSATATLLIGLDEAGRGGDPRPQAARRWIESAQRREPFFVTGAPAGGWGWSLPSGWPNADDTCSAILALTRLGVPPEAPPVAAGVRFLRSRQGRGGGFGCFLRGARLSLDAPCPVFTAHALEALAAAGARPGDAAVDAGLRFLARAQRPDGAVPALWYRGWTAGTAAALCALATLGRRDDPVARRCLGWLLARQRGDGSWGAGDGGDGDATVEETSWALAALLAAGVPPGDAPASDAARWLVDRQRPAGDWPPSLVGVYFPSLLYHDDVLAAGWALRALGSYRRALAEQGETP